jgi:hypothetical protein
MLYSCSIAQLTEHQVGVAPAGPVTYPHTCPRTHVKNQGNGLLATAAEVAEGQTPASC